MSIQKAREVFGKRASYYVTSKAHTDRLVLARVAELAKPHADDLVLDVATGAGHTAFALADYVRWVHATDITPEMLEKAREAQARRGKRNMEFSIADVHDLPFEDEFFNIVTCRRAAHHFTDIKKAMSEMKRVLKPGGRLVVDDRSVPEDDFIDATMNQLDLLHDESHVREYRPSEWEKIMQEAGFTIMSIETYTRHRPLSSFTEDVCEENTAKIHRIVASLTPAQRQAMNVTEEEEGTYTDHWFVMVAGVKD